MVIRTRTVGGSTLHATLPYGSATPMPAPDVWVPWVASVEGKLDNAPTGRGRRKCAERLWRGDLEIAGGLQPGLSGLARRPQTEDT